MKIKVDINSAKIGKRLRLDQVQKYVASEVKRLCDPYVPKQQGTLQSSATIASDGSAIVYTAPYAHYQYYGEVMGPNYQDKKGDWHSGRAPKHYTGKPLDYHGAPMRGKEWDKRMLADKKADLVRNVEIFIKRG